MRNMVCVAALLAAAGSAQAQWSDDFNRPDGPIGGDWTVTTGTWGILSNRGQHTSAGVNEVLTHSLASANYATITSKLDVFRPAGTTASTLVGFLIGLGGTDTIQVKLQSQGTNADFNFVGIYHRTSATGWGPWAGGLAFTALTSNFSSARLTVSFPNPDTVKLEIDTNFDGVTDQTYMSSGITSGTAPFGMNLGTGQGIIGWAVNTSSFDNWSITPGGGPPPCYANCDASTVAPILNVNDFTCFLNIYAAGSTAANCDASTVVPVLNVNDFTCFTNAYAAGCP